LNKKASFSAEAATLDSSLQQKKGKKKKPKNKVKTSGDAPRDSDRVGCTVTLSAVRGLAD
jgi:hypothetical protein